MAKERGLGASASRGAAFTMSGQLARVFIQLAGVALLARLLSPGDYGLIAMVVAIIGVGELVRDFGLSSASIQAKELSRDQRDNLFWISSGLGGFFALLVIVCSSLIALLYGEPRLHLLSVVLSSTFLINGMSAQFRAGLTRSLRLGTLSLIEILAQALGLATGVFMALAGTGYWALAGQQIAQALVLLLVMAGFSKWHPRWYHPAAPMRGLLSFGINLFASQLLVYASRNIDSVIIGARLGAAPLGFYNRAFQLLLLPLNQINAPASRVALPVLSRLQDEAARYRDFLIAGQTVVLQAVLGVFSVGCALAGPLVNLVLGNQWGESVPLFQIMCVAGAFQAAGYATYWVFLSKGLTKSQLLYSLATRPALIALIVFGSFWGVTGVAWAYSIGTMLLWPIGLLWLRRVSDAPARDMFVTGLRAITAFGVAGVACYALPYLVVKPASELGTIAWGVVGWILAWGLQLLTWPAFRRDGQVIVRTLKLLRK
jgi:O-antigen/teichoic acid export membrane protein